MMFDEKSLNLVYWFWARQEVLYFEVALKNGIPFSLIANKKKIEVGKVRFDKTIATLQRNDR
jgi:DNA mismatch repair protein MutS2